MTVFGGVPNVVARKVFSAFCSAKPSDVVGAHPFMKTLMKPASQSQNGSWADVEKVSANSAPVGVGPVSSATTEEAIA